MSRLRRSLYLELEVGAPGHEQLSWLNRVLVAVILAAVISAVVQTEPMIERGREGMFLALEHLFGVVFGVEYLARVWVSAENPRFAGRSGPLRYMLTPAALVDLAVVLVSLAPVHAPEVLPLRMLRLLAIVRFARLGRFSRATRHLFEAIAARRYELFITLTLAGAMILLGATAMWLVEGHIQPAAYGSIPRAMWWSAVTLTTIGYGDVYPVTPLGRVIAVFLGMSGIALIAMPTGIMAAAFSDAMQRTRGRPAQPTLAPRPGVLFPQAHEDLPMDPSEAQPEPRG